MKMTLKDSVVVLCSGGDSPGMNAFIRGMARIGLNRHERAVIGVKDGYRGLVRTARQVDGVADGLEKLAEKLISQRGYAGLLDPHQHMVALDHAAVSGIVGHGGTMLGSARCLEFHREDIRAGVLRMLEGLGVAALVVCGGDGSLSGAKRLAEEGQVQVIGVPGTIDNDLEFTDMALGVDTAVSTLVWAVEHFKDTARAHRRVMVLETMGRGSGELAMRAAISSGAEIVLTPEHGPYTEEHLVEIAQGLEGSMQRGRSHAIVLVAEGVTFEPANSNPYKAMVVADAIAKHFGRSGSTARDTEIRPSVLGHLQRGGRPTPSDCLLAAQFAEKAWHSIVTGAGHGVTALRDGQVALISFSAAPARSREARCRRLTEMQRDLSGW